jgi:tape measure domain-containing protein
MARGLRKLEWILSLRDRVSAPAAKATKALDGYQRALRRSQQFSGRANVNRRLTRGFSDAVRMARATGREVTETTSAFGMLGEAAPAFAAIGGAALAAAAGVARLGVAFGAAVVHETAFQESTMTTLRTMLGSGQAARDEFARSLAFARQTPLDTADVIRLRTRLVTSGFRDTRERDVMTSLLTDVASAQGGNTEAMFNALRGFSQMRASGRFNMEDFNQIRDATGVSTRDVFLRIARARGLRGNDDSQFRQVEQLMRRGQIGAGAGEVAIAESIRQMHGGGPLGSLSGALSQTIPGMLSNLRSAFSDLMQGLDLERLPGIKALKNVLAGLVNGLSAGSSTGKRLQAVLRNIINTVGMGLFDGLDVTSILERAIGFVERLGGWLRYIWTNAVQPLAAGLRAGFGEALAPMVELVRRLFSQGPKGAKLSDTMRTVGRVLGFVGGALVLIGGAMAGFSVMIGRVISRIAPLVMWTMDARAAVLAWFGALHEYLPGGKNDLGKRFEQLGAAIVQGIWTGLAMAWGGLLANFQALLEQLPAGVRRVLGIHSPSRVMAELGAYTAEGFQRGLDGATPRLQLAMGDLVAAPRGMAGANAGGGTTVTGNNITVQVYANGDADNVADAVAGALPDAIAEALAQLLGQRPALSG